MPIPSCIQTYANDTRAFTCTSAGTSWPGNYPLQAVEILWLSFGAWDAATCKLVLGPCPAVRGSATSAGSASSHRHTCSQAGPWWCKAAYRPHSDNASLYCRTTCSTMRQQPAAHGQRAAPEVYQAFPSGSRSILQVKGWVR